MTNERHNVDQAVGTELEAIRAAHNGLLRPADVIDAARDEDSVLHSQFEWDDSAAAHQHRLEQARGLIRAVVRMIPQEGNKDIQTPAFVSLSPQRSKAGGGYVAMADVLSDFELHAQYLADAVHELNRVRRKYEMARELENIFREVDTAFEKYGVKQKG